MRSSDDRAIAARTRLLGEELIAEKQVLRGDGADLAKLHNDPRWAGLAKLLPKYEFTD